MKETEQIINKTREYINLSKTDISDDDLWKITKNFLLVARITLEIRVIKLIEAIIDSFKKCLKITP